MPDVRGRVARLSEERRSLLENLLRRKQDPAAVRPAQPRTDPPPNLEMAPGSSPEDAKVNARRFYNTVSRQLNSSDFGSVSYFLNFGFKSDGGREHSVIELPPHVLNKNSVRLVLELIGECDLGGRSVLDVGCGRGGLISVIQTYFTPRSVAGLDLSSEAIRFCRRTHGRSGAVFLEGDAERLPFREGSFDVVSNLESSHSYPMIGAFYSEVRRVLKPGGHFLYSDLFPRNEMERHVNELRRLGFSVLKDHDITRNVVLSCDEIAEMRTQSFAQTNDPLLLDEFLATPASAVYQDMARGITTYRIFDLRLTEST